MKINNIHTIIKLLKKEIKKFVLPSVTTIANKNKDPFLVLISCLLSLRTKDQVTSNASERLFKLAKTPLELSKLRTKIIEKIIYPVGFYKTKAKRIVEISKILIKDYNGKVPEQLEELLKLNGVGRKTANLVIILGYNKYGICVDTHVHRISNRLGFVKTKTPEKTEFELRIKLPKKYWKIYNNLLVSHGQNICKPISPFCSKCIINKYCDKVGVLKYR